MFATASETVTAAQISWLPVVVIGVVAVVLVAAIVAYAARYLSRTITGAIGGIATTFDGRFTELERKVDTLSENMSGVSSSVVVHQDGLGGQGSTSVVAGNSRGGNGRTARA